MIPALTEPRDRAWVEVDLEALLDNARTIVAHTSARLLPMVKANGYGLGAVPVARALTALEPWGFGVAIATEGRELREAGMNGPIAVFTPFVPSAREVFERDDLRPAIGDLEALRAWLTTRRPFHLEIDTGMGRAGLRAADAEALATARSLLQDAPGFEGVFTHFHSADSDTASVLEQWERLQQVVRTLPRRPEFVHGANSAASCLVPECAGDLARPGIFLYGGTEGGLTPCPVARLQARVVAVRRLEPGDTVSYGAMFVARHATNVATLGIGYADGVPRALSGRGRVELHEKVYRIAGRVTMDMTMLDVGQDEVHVGDVATVWGGKVGLEEQAAAAGTVSYELLTAVGARVPRVYREG